MIIHTISINFRLREWKKNTDIESNDYENIECYSV